MSLYEFYLLSQNEQLEALYNNGVYVGKRKANNLTVILFQLDTFYVEIFYRKYRYFISSIQGFTSTEKLEPYLGQIDVNPIVKVENL